MIFKSAAVQEFMVTVATMYLSQIIKELIYIRDCAVDFVVVVLGQLGRLFWG